MENKLSSDSPNRNAKSPVNLVTSPMQKMRDELKPRKLQQQQQQDTPLDGNGSIGSHSSNSGNTGKKVRHRGRKKKENKEEEETTIDENKEQQEVVVEEEEEVDREKLEKRLKLLKKKLRQIEGLKQKGELLLSEAELIKVKQEDETVDEINQIELKLSS